MCNQMLKIPYSQTVIVSATGSDTTSNNETVATGHGNVFAIDVVVSNDTIAVVDGIKFTLANNGRDFMENEPAILYSPLYRGTDKKRFVPIAAGGILDYSIVNDQATAVVFYFILYFDGVLDNMKC